MSDYVKHTTHTDALDTLGMIIGDGEQRDAIHLAVEPVVAAVDLVAGKHVGRMPDGSYGPHAEKLVGIVDPFLLRGPTKGQRFWLLVYPRQITSLRHHWEHPDFDPIEPSGTARTDAVAQAKAWVENYAQELSGADYDDEVRTVTYEDLMSTADEHECGDWSYLVRGGLLEGVSTSDEFWHYWSVIRGRAPREQGNFFSCSC